MRVRPVAIVLVAATAIAACGETESGLVAPASTSTPTDTPTPTTLDPATSSTTPSPTTLDTAPPSTSVESVPEAPLAIGLDRCADVPFVATDVVGDRGLGFIDPVFNGVLTSYANERRDTFGGIWIDREALGTIVIAFTDDPAAHLEALAARRPSPDDFQNVDPPEPITDDRPIGEWGVPFDVVQVDFTEDELIGVQPDVFAAAGNAWGEVVGVGLDTRRNRISIESAAPITPADVDELEEIVGQRVDDPRMVCWEAELVDRLPDPIEPGTTLDAIQLPGPDGTYPPGTEVVCDGLRTTVGELATPVPLSEADAGLVALFEEGQATELGAALPTGPWYVFVNDGRAMVVHVAEGMWMLGAELGANGWIYSGYSSGRMCDVRLPLPDGLSAVEWVVDPAAPLDRSTAEINVLATEVSCASGQEMGERLLQPDVVETEDAVLISFAAIALVGEADCPGNPSTPVTIELAAPVGDREVREGLILGPLSAWFGG